MLKFVDFENVKMFNRIENEVLRHFKIVFTDIYS